MTQPDRTTGIAREYMTAIIFAVLHAAEADRKGDLDVREFHLKVAMATAGSLMSDPVMVEGYNRYVAMRDSEPEQTRQ